MKYQLMAILNKLYHTRSSRILTYVCEQRTIVLIIRSRMKAAQRLWDTILLYFYLV
jgi:hypothetical protein